MKWYVVSIAVIEAAIVCCNRMAVKCPQVDSVQLFPVQGHPTRIELDKNHLQPPSL